MPSSAEAGAAERAWAALAAALALASCLAFMLGSATALDWQPALAWRQPWRAWSSAWVHYSVLHLVANLMGCLLVAALGVVARVPLRIVVAWFIAWPLTQFGLLLRPELLHYGGLSGVLHAGVAAVAVSLIAEGRGSRRLIGIGVLLGVGIKVFLEAPWGDALRHSTGWDIAVAPFAHLTGLVAGALTAGIAEAVRSRPTTIDRND